MSYSWIVLEFLKISVIVEETDFPNWKNHKQKIKCHKNFEIQNVMGMQLIILQSQNVSDIIPSEFPQKTFPFREKLPYDENHMFLNISFFLNCSSPNKSVLEFRNDLKTVVMLEFPQTNFSRSENFYMKLGNFKI